LVHQKDRDVIPDRIDAVTGVAFQGFRVRLENERLLANRADQDFQQVLRDHGRIVRQGAARKRGGAALGICIAQFRMEDGRWCGAEKGSHHRGHGGKQNLLTTKIAEGEPLRTRGKHRAAD
jgi:hypothetical protein